MNAKKELDRGREVMTLFMDIGIDYAMGAGGVCAICNHPWSQHSCGDFGPCVTPDCNCRAFITKEQKKCIDTVNELLEERGT